MHFKTATLQSVAVTFYSPLTKVSACVCRLFTVRSGDVREPWGILYSSAAHPTREAAPRKERTMYNHELVTRLIADKQQSLETSAATERQLRTGGQGLRRAWLLDLLPPPLSKIRTTYLLGRR